jgi:hypothetical protein
MDATIPTNDANETTSDAPSAPLPARKARGASWWDVVRDNYLAFDRRTLGFARIVFGFLLITDLFRRRNAWWQMFADDGVLPNHVNLFRPQASGAFSIVNAFSSHAECWALFIVILATYVCLFVGYRTKLAQVLALVFVTGMNGRVLLIENGGYVVHNLVALWTCFLPLGDRFSVDALLASMRRKRERTATELNEREELVEPWRVTPHVSLLGFVFFVQLAAIYYFNVIHKTGPAWKNGTAVHFVLYVDRMVTPYVAMIRDYVPNFAILVMTKTTLAAEAAIPICLMSPLGRVWTKRAALVLINMLHIAFGTVFVLGPFAWSACAFSTLLISREDWALLEKTMRRTHRARTVVFDPRSGAALFACRLLARADLMHLLTFEDAAVRGLEIVRPDGTRAARSEAMADIVAALPVGPTVAWILRLPAIRSLVDAGLGAAEGGAASRWFGVQPPQPKHVSGSSPLGRKLGYVTTTVRELLILAFFVGAVNQALVELWCINRRIKVPQPEAIRLLAQKARFLQGWFMFSPNPVMDDGTIVVDALTIDGRHVDPFWATTPNFDLIHAKSFGYNQIWSDYFNRMHLPGNSYYREAMKDYMYRLAERTGNPNDEIVSGDVYWVQDMNPKWNETSSWKEERNKLFSFENPRHRAQALRD